MSNDTPEREAEIRGAYGALAGARRTGDPVWQDIGYLLDALDREREAARGVLELAEVCGLRDADAVRRLRALLHPEDASEGGK